MKQTIFWVYKGLVWGILVTALIQFFLAGLGAFEATDFMPHAIVGLLLVPASLLLLLIAVVAGFVRALSWGRVGMTAALFALMFIQMFLGGPMQDISLYVAALHPVNGLILLVLLYALVRGRSLSQLAEEGAEEQKAGTTQRVR
ncbi:MAG: DUF6220 domain-containing protein [Rubrobacteraceae bacterium]